MFLKPSLKIVILLLVIIVSTPNVQAQISTGKWNATLQLHENISLPFRLTSHHKNNSIEFVVQNAEEKIVLRNLKQEGDTFSVQFPDFNSVLKFKATKKELRGYWINYNKTDYQIPFEAKLESKQNKKIRKNDFDYTGKWKTVFDPQTKDSSLAIGIFSSKGKHITGTFLTETGDYRFLEGEINGNKMYLSCLDGSHAFLVQGEIKDGKITGKFYSGSHYSTTWEATLDSSFELKNPEKITYLTSDKPIEFQLKDIDGVQYIYPNEETNNKVVIIQIMGTWCPNCMDETKFLKQMHAKYHQKGLEIISIGYEYPDTFEGQAQKIKLLKERYQLDFKFLVGGKANKEIVSKDFYMLNSISSFPTCIFIDRNGNVQKIHTGFNGPGTGAIYKTYVKETEELIHKLINQ